MLRDELYAYLNALLKPELFQDYSPNGLQVQGKAEIKKIVTGVTASQALIDRAIAVGADALFVHHGYFWKGEDERLTGIKGKRIKALMQHDLNLFAYHLPLDGHTIYGNNAQLAKLFGFKVTGPTGESNTDIVFHTTLAKSIGGAELAKHIGEKLQRQPLHIAADVPIKKIAWCTGGAQDYIHQAIDLGADAFITGEASERTVHIARENNLHFYAAGHHATERYGAKAIGEHLADKFDLECEFVDIDNPV